LDIIWYRCPSLLMQKALEASGFLEDTLDTQLVHTSVDRSV
jgi:hypothetical protein